LTTTFDAGANRLGALALRLADRLSDALRETGHQSDSSATALVVIHHVLDTPSVDQLSRVLGLSSPATVRLVDRLVADGLATRGRGADARVSIVRLTRAGQRRARQISAARADVVLDALAPLSASERTALYALVDKMLVGLVPTPTSRGWMCRLCATDVCGAQRGQPCPITLPALG
jgi:MarR family transcriptional repressor of emrRAB